MVSFHSVTLILPQVLILTKASLILVLFQFQVSRWGSHLLPGAADARHHAHVHRRAGHGRWEVGAKRQHMLLYQMDFFSGENLPVCKGVINQPKLRLNDFLKNPLINISDFCADATRTQEGRVTETRFICDAGNMWADTEQCSSLSTAHLLPLC